MDPFTQSFNITTSVPSTFDSNLTISIGDVNAYLQYALLICIEYAVQAGACFLLFMTLLLTTKTDKRYSPVFLLNTTAVLLSAVRNVLQLLYFTGPFYDFYAYVSGDYSRVPRNAYAISIAGVSLVLLLLVCIEASLILQVHAVSAAMTSLHRSLLMSAGILIALLAIGFRLALTVYNVRAILNVQDFGDYMWLAATSNGVVTGSICFFSAIFVGKLVSLLFKRYQMGIKGWGAMQIIAVGGCQTLIIPAVFAMLQNFTAVPELGSFVLTLTSIFMPLSTLWATATTEDQRLESQEIERNIRGNADQRGTVDTHGSTRPLNAASSTAKHHRLLSTDSRSDTSRSQSTMGGHELGKDLADGCVEPGDHQPRNWLGVVIGGDDAFKHGHEMLPDHEKGSMVKADVQREMRYIDTVLQDLEK